MDFCTVKTNNVSKTVSLKALCQQNLLQAGIYSFLGPQIGQLDADFISNMLPFTKHAWMLFYGLPSKLSSAARTPQRALIQTLQKFAALSEKRRSNQSWGVQQILIASEAVGVDPDTRAGMLLMLLWAEATCEFIWESEG